MLTLRLPPDIEQRLDALAKKTGHSKSYYAREAILRQIEDIEDYYLARRRLARGGSRVTLENVEQQLGRPKKRGYASGADVLAIDDWRRFCGPHPEEHVRVSAHASRRMAKDERLSTRPSFETFGPWRGPNSSG